MRSTFVMSTPKPTIIKAPDREWQPFARYHNYTDHGEHFTANDPGECP
jgi:hypothetical protein